MSLVKNVKVMKFFLLNLLMLMENLALPSLPALQGPLWGLGSPVSKSGLDLVLDVELVWVLAMVLGGELRMMTNRNTVMWESYWAADLGIVQICKCFFVSWRVIR